MPIVRLIDRDGVSFFFLSFFTLAGDDMARLRVKDRGSAASSRCSVEKKRKKKQKSFSLLKRTQQKKEKSDFSRLIFRG